MSGPTRGIAARVRRRALRRACLLLVAALAQILITGAPASAAATGVPAVAVQSGTAPMTTSSGIAASSATLVEEVEEHLRKQAELARQGREVVAAAEKITKDAAALDKKKKAAEAEATAVNKKADAFNTRANALSSKIDAHNSKPNRFQLPAQAAAANAYEAEANQLRAEQSQLRSEQSSLRAQQARLSQWQSALSAQQAQLAAETRAHDAKVSELEGKERQLDAEGQQLQQQIAEALQSLAADPPDPAATMDQGGDAAVPPQQADQTTEQGADTAGGGDTPSRLSQNAALQSYAKRTGTTVDMRPGTAYLTPGAVRALPAAQAAQLGSPSGTYDGLVRRPNGQYTALEVRRPGAVSTPRQAAFRAAIANGGTAQVTIDDKTYVISNVTPVRPAPVPGGSPTSPRRNSKADCLTRPRGENSGDGWIEYTTKGVDHINQGPPKGTRGVRAEGATACLTKSLDKGTTATGDITGWADAAKKAAGKRARCHLISRELGGRGTARQDQERNLVPCWQRGTNTTSFGMRPYEQLVHKAVMRVGPYAGLEKGLAVLYEVTPEYKNDKSTIPRAITMTAMIQQPDGSTWPLFFPVTIQNVPAGGGPNLGN
ncbi:DNA/RNA non-specific endonuclease [Streptomyces sp. NPDC048581]|uniref:DNA/RNA non-specific endonuclease n=1 Tax=Streptomyces sp. NPDC048581 TaxID=3365572 RepID=UPI003712E057